MSARASMALVAVATLYGLIAVGPPLPAPAQDAVPAAAPTAQVPVPAVHAPPTAAHARLPAPFSRGTQTASAVVRAAAVQPRTAAPAVHRTLDDRAVPLEDSWRQQTPDPRWSDELREHLEAAISDLEIDGAVREAACRTTLCRVELQLTSSDDGQRLQELAGDPGQPKEIRFSEHEDGLLVTVYLFRGSEYPTAETNSQTPHP